MNVHLYIAWMFIYLLSLYWLLAILSWLTIDRRIDDFGSTLLAKEEWQFRSVEFTKEKKKCCSAVNKSKPYQSLRKHSSLHEIFYTTIFCIMFVLSEGFWILIDLVKCVCCMYSSNNTLNYICARPHARRGKSQLKYLQIRRGLRLQLCVSVIRSIPHSMSRWLCGLSFIKSDTIQSHAH